jgi:PAS domain S-box-containing protein
MLSQTCQLPVGAYSLKKKPAARLRPAQGKPVGESNPRLAGSRALLASIVDSSNDAIIGKTLEGVIQSWNRAAEAMYGYAADEVVGQNISILVPPDRADEIPRILEEIRRGDRVENFESIRIAKDKRRLKVSITISPIRAADGRIVGASAIARDLTAMEQARAALRESESTAHAFFQSAAQAIFIVDPAGHIVMANPATERMFGYAVSELIGKPVEVLVPDQFQAGHKQHRDRFFRHPQMRPMGLGLDLLARRKDGTEFFVEISLSHIHAAQGTLGVALVTDISKRRADEQAIRLQGEELRALAARLMTAQDDERRRIARDLHDDLSQNLAFLAMDLGKLATKPGAQDLLADIRPLQLRASDVAENVRRLSHQLHPSILDDIGLEAALEHYCEEFEQRSGITTRFTSRGVPDPLPREVASSIYHIAQECLRNVSKHAQTKTVSVTIEFVDRMLRLIIKDQGVGWKTEQPEANGIGIVAMRERAHLVNGTLSIQSKTGAGTEVSVDVPVIPSA